MIFKQENLPFLKKKNEWKMVDKQTRQGILKVLFYDAIRCLILWNTMSDQNRYIDMPKTMKNNLFKKNKFLYLPVAGMLDLNQKET